MESVTKLELMYRLYIFGMGNEVKVIDGKVHIKRLMDNVGLSLLYNSIGINQFTKEFNPLLEKHNTNLDEAFKRAKSAIDMLQQHLFSF